jgi:hypothetical protein
MRSLTPSFTARPDHLGLVVGFAAPLRRVGPGGRGQHEEQRGQQREERAQRAERREAGGEAPGRPNAGFGRGDAEVHGRSPGERRAASASSHC